MGKDMQLNKKSQKFTYSKNLPYMVCHVLIANSGVYCYVPFNDKSLLMYCTQ